MMISCQFENKTGFGRSLFVNPNIESKSISFEIQLQGPGLFKKVEFADFAEACEQYDALWEELTGNAA